MSQQQVNHLPASNATELVLCQEQFFNSVLTTDAIKWQKESQFAIQAMQKNDFLAKTAMQNQASLQNAIINVASIGISLNPANKHAYLVPRDGFVCLDLSYMGLLHLAMQSGSIIWGQAKIVYANDEYVNEGLDKPPTHKYKSFGDRGEPVGVYCTVKTPGGDYLTEEMDKSQVYDIRARSKAFTSGKKCPWNTDELEMWRKTVVKRASKYWPSCERLNVAIDALNQHEGFDEIDNGEQRKKDLADQIAHFHKLLETGDAMAFTAFLQTREENDQGHMYASFEKGKISSGKERSRKLNSEGFEIWKETKSEIKSMIAEGDAFGCIEITEEMAGYERKYLSILLGEHLTSELKALIEGVK